MGIHSGRDMGMLAEAVKVEKSSIVTSYIGQGYVTPFSQVINRVIESAALKGACGAGLAWILCQFTCDKN